MTVFRFKFHHAIEQSETDQPLQATQRAFAACIRCNIFIFCFHHFETLSSNMPILYNNCDQKNINLEKSISIKYYKYLHVLKEKHSTQLFFLKEKIEGANS